MSDEESRVRFRAFLSPQFHNRRDNISLRNISIYIWYLFFILSWFILWFISWIVFVLFCLFLTRFPLHRAVTLTKNFTRSPQALQRRLWRTKKMTALSQRKNVHIYPQRTISKFIRCFVSCMNTDYLFLFIFDSWDHSQHQNTSQTRLAHPHIQTNNPKKTRTEQKARRQRLLSPDRSDAFSDKTPAHESW